MLGSNKTAHHLLSWHHLGAALSGRQSGHLVMLQAARSAHMITISISRNDRDKVAGNDLCTLIPASFFIFNQGHSTVMFNLEDK
jgi:hypothetical protein